MMTIELGLAPVEMRAVSACVPPGDSVQRAAPIAANGPAICAASPVSSLPDLSIFRVARRRLTAPDRPARGGGRRPAT